MRLLLIDPAMDAPETQGEASVVGAWPGSTEIRRPAIDGDGPRPGELDGFDAVVLLGSRASVHDDHPWLVDLRQWLLPIVTGQYRVPLLGVCFGHQLVAHVAGATVGFLREDHSKLVGFEQTLFTNARLVPEQTSLPVIASHREEVKTVPPGFKVVGTRPSSQQDALEHRELPIFTVQFHPEARDEFVGRMQLPQAVYDGRLDPALAAAGDRLIRAFFSLVLAQDE